MISFFYISIFFSIESGSPSNGVFYFISFLFDVLMMMKPPAPSSSKPSESKYTLFYLSFSPDYQSSLFAISFLTSNTNTNNCDDNNNILQS